MKITVLFTLKSLSPWINLFYKQAFYFRSVWGARAIKSKYKILFQYYFGRRLSYGICSFIFNFLKVQKQSKIKVAKAHFWFVSTERVISCLRKTIHSRITFVSWNLSGPIKICSCIMLLCTSNEIFVSQSENIVKKLFVSWGIFYFFLWNYFIIKYFYKTVQIYFSFSSFYRLQKVFSHSYLFFKVYN